MEFLNRDLEMDLENLISCIECHKEEENADIIIETFKTIVNMCTEEEAAKDAFREVGGLDFLLQFIIDTDQVFVLEFGLKVLAFVIDGNVHNQMHMTEDKVFRILQTIFKRKTYPPSLFKNATVLFSTLLFQNRSAQDIIQENGSLLSLMNMYRYFLPFRGNYSNAIEESEHLEVWLAINSALCFAVNNPLHEKNQETCSSLFSLSLNIIETTLNPVIIEATSSFLSLSIASNEKNQDLFAELDGFQILKHSLMRNFEEIQSCITECNSIIRKKSLQILNSLVAIVNATVLDHENNASLCGKVGIISVMTKLLSTTALDFSGMKRILLFLGHCIDACSENRFIILEVPNLDVLLKRNLEIDDQELHSAARYLLQVCLNETNKENEMNQDCYSETDYNPFLKSFHQRHKVHAHPRRGNFLQEDNSHGSTNRPSGILGIHNYTLSEEFQNLNSELYPLKVFSQNSAIPTTCTENKNYGNHSSESVDSSLQSAGHLYRLSHQISKQKARENHMQSIQKNKLNNCALDEERQLNTYLEINHSSIKSMTDCKIPNQKSSKCALENSSCNDRKCYTEKLPSFKNIPKQKSSKCALENSSCNDRKCYTEKLPSFKNKNKDSSHKKKSAKTAGCMEVIVLPGVACNEHRLVTQLELLKVCPLKPSKNTNI